jgi:hypothetical protein
MISDASGPKQSGASGRLVLGCAVLVFVGWSLVIWLWRPVIYCLTADDSYYYLVTAKNAAHGFGFTFDQINPTNGFHPLWAYLLVPLYWLFGANMETFVRSVLTIQLVFVLLGAEILARGLKDHKRFLLLATSILLVNFYFTKTLVNGLESALQWLLMCTTLAQMLRLLERGVESTNNWQFFGLGVLAGLTILSRLTAVWFAGAVLLLCLIVLGRRDSRSSWLSVIGRVAAAAVGICLVVVPYSVENYLSTGHFETVSASVKVSRAYPFRAHVWIAIIGYALVGLAMGVFLWRNRRGEPLARRFLWAMFPVLAYLVAQWEADAILRHVNVSEIWSMVPLSLGATLFLAYAFSGNLLKGTRRARRAALALALTGLMAFAGFTWSYILNPESYGWYVHSRQMADWIRTHTAPDAVIGAWDAGVLGAYCDRRTVNLDGLINSWDFKENLDKGLAVQWITDVCPIDYLAHSFLDEHVNLDEMKDFHWWIPLADRPDNRIDLTKWNVVYDDRSVNQNWTDRGGRREYVFLVLTRKDEGIPLTEFLKRQGRL